MTSVVPTSAENVIAFLDYSYYDTYMDVRFVLQVPDTLHAFDMATWTYVSKDPASQFGDFETSGTIIDRADNDRMFTIRYMGKLYIPGILIVKIDGYDQIPVLIQRISADDGKNNTTLLHFEVGSSTVTGPTGEVYSADGTAPTTGNQVLVYPTASPTLSDMQTVVSTQLTPVTTNFNTKFAQLLSAIQNIDTSGGTGGGTGGSGSTSANTTMNYSFVAIIVIVSVVMGIFISRALRF